MRACARAKVRGGDLYPFLVDVQDGGEDAHGTSASRLHGTATDQPPHLQHQHHHHHHQQELRRRRGGRGREEPDHPSATSATQQQQQQGERRVVFLSSWGTEERAEWVDALSR